MRLLALGALVALLAAPPALAGHKTKTTPAPPVSPAASVYVEQVPTTPTAHTGGGNKAAGTTSGGSGGAPVGLIVGGVAALLTLSAAVAFRTRSARRRHA